MAERHSPGVVHEAAQHAAAAPEESVLAPKVMPEVGAPPEEPRPDLHRTKEALARGGGGSLSISILTALATLYTLYFARSFLLPIVFAVLLNFLLSPAVRTLGRAHFPDALGAAIVVLVLVGALGGGIFTLAGPAEGWISSAPQSVAKARTRIRSLIRPVQRVTQKVEQAAGAVTEATPTPKQPPVVVQAGPTVASRLFGTTERLLAALLEIVVLLYFLLAGGDLFLEKLVRVLPHFHDKVKAVEIARATEAAVSAYLSTAFLVNAGEGIVVAILLWLIGMPNAALWGTMIAFVEFVPYLGALSAVVVLAVAGLTTFPSVGHALLVPAAYLAVNLIQANIVTPLLLGHRLTLNPVAIFVGLGFFFWIWGIPGAFVAVPILASFKILCDHIASLAAIGEFLGGR